MKRDYDLLARSVPCPRCGAAKGARCFGRPPGPYRIKHTYCARRALATETRRESRIP